MPLTATERLELLETWSRRSFVAMASCAVLLALMLIHMIYAQVTIANYRASLDVKNAKSDHDLEEMNKAAEARLDARLAQNQKNLDDLKRIPDPLRNLTPDTRLDPVEEKKEPE